MTDGLLSVRSPSAMRRWGWRFWGRLLLTIVLLAALFWRIDLAGFAAAVRMASIPVLAAAVIVNSLTLIISASKWQLLLRGVGVHARLALLLQLYTMGFFVNAFLPGVVGGDVVRWQLTRRRLGHGLKVAATIVAERATGVLALLTLAIAAGLFLLPRGDRSALGLLLVGASLALVGLAAVVLNRRLALAVVRRTPGGSPRKIALALKRLQGTLRRVPRGPLLGAVVYSVFFYLSAGLTFFVVCVAFGADVSLLEAMSVQVLIMLLIMVPISIGGLGVAQVGDVYLLGLLGVDPPTALGISLTRMAVAYVYAVVGGLLLGRWRLGDAGRLGEAQVNVYPETPRP